MSKTEFAKLLEDAARNGTLLTDKHDPNQLSRLRSKRRTVIAAELAPVLPEFLASLDYDVTHYINNNAPCTPDVWEITPRNPLFSVPGSGVPPNSSTPTTQCDRLLVVSGSNQGLHIYGESHSKIQQRVSAGTYTNPQLL